MNFVITGRVYEQETGQPLPGLKLRAYDKDLFFDDLLGESVSDEHGRFRIEYREADFRELFEHKPDIYFSVYDTKLHKITDTRDSVRWNAGREEEFEIAISRKDLHEGPEETPDDVISAGLRVTADEFRVEDSNGYQRPELPGFAPAGLPGEPALPSQFQYLAIPIGAEVLEIEVDLGEPLIIDDINQPMAIQEAYPDLGINPEEFGDGVTFMDIAPTFTPLADKYMRGREPFPKELVRMEKQEEFGPVQLIAVKVTPVQYDPVRHAYLFYPNLTYRTNIKKQLSQSDTVRPGEWGYAEAEVTAQVLGMELVFPAKDLLLPGRLVWEEAQHVVITDNYQWPECVDRGDGTTRAPTLSERGLELNGDMISEFDRLAQWKTAKGVRSKLVTVSQIVSGTFGDMTQGGIARDLQEVIRNFVKYAKSNWKSGYFLMAGDFNVVPIRKLCGCSLYGTIGVGQVNNNPPDKGQCTLIAGKHTAKLHPRFTPTADAPLAALGSGLRVPFDRDAGAGRLGWYFTSESDFLNKDDGFDRLPAGQASQFIIVEGPETDINDHFYWLREVNAIPSDFYYASILGEGYSQPGNHDFDLNNNGLYGQFYWDENGDHSLDGVDWGVDVFVGRASVESGTQAEAFVNKVIAYERLENSSGDAIDTNYLRKVIYASALWSNWHSHNRQVDTAIPPIEGAFTHAAGATETKLRLDFDVTLVGGVPSHRMIARMGNSDNVIDYNTSASASNLGWYFCTNDSYSTQSTSATRFIRIQGPQVAIDPDQFNWDVMGLELSAAEKEDLRLRMNGWFPHFTDVQRHYDDYFDLSMPPGLDSLEATQLKNEIDQGCHFLSLTGHGWSGGCCGINTYSQNFANTDKYFVAFADSCSTARIDANDSAAEALTNDPDGGAIAYIGNTRYSWIGIGDNFERFFWAKLSVTGRPGIAANLRLSSGGARWPWVIYAQNLFGDPEMPVYTEMPTILKVAHSDVAYWGGQLSVNVAAGGRALANAKVTIMAGWKGGLVRPQVLQSKYSNAFGNAGFNIPERGDYPAESLQITVTKQNCKPYVCNVELLSQEATALRKEKLVAEEFE